MDYLTSYSIKNTSPTNRNISNSLQETTDNKPAYQNGVHDVNKNMAEDSDDDSGPDVDDIDIEALLNRPRNFGRLRRSNPLESAPDFVKRLDPFNEVPCGVLVVLECKISAFPTADVRWFMDDEEIDMQHPRYVLDADILHGVHRLIIEHAGKRDEGAFKCKAENLEGVASTTGYLSVLGDNKSDASSNNNNTSSGRRLQREPAITSAPNLCTIIEQKSMEEREAKAQAEQGPSPIQGYINNIRKGTSWTLINMMHLYHSLTNSKDEDEEEEKESTSTDSQHDSIDTSEPSTPTGECDVTMRTPGRTASWAELTDAFLGVGKQEHDVEIDEYNIEKESTKQNADTDSGIFENPDSINKNINETNIEPLESGKTANDTFYIGEELISQESAVNANASPYDINSSRQNLKEGDTARNTNDQIKEQKRLRLKRQKSLVQITFDWCVVKALSIFGDQLDTALPYYFAFIIIAACFAAATELSLYYLIPVTAVLSFISFCFMNKQNQPL